MTCKPTLLFIAALLIISTATAQISPGLEDKLDQKPNTTKVDAIILTQPNANERARNAVKNANGNVSHDFNIIDGVAVSIPKVAAENLANRDFVREIQPDYNVKTRLSESTSTVNAEEVWNQNTTGAGVDVAVLDTGIEDNTILNIEDQVDYTGEGTDDLNGHGTHVAGTIASPDEEYRGVAYEADLFDVKVLDQEGTGSASDVIAGLEWAADNNAEIATLSLGAEVDQCDGTSSLSEAVDNTVEQGVTVTVAAGNNGPDNETITAPGCAQKPITVGSSGNGEISDFSSRGPTADGRTKPDLVAPGESITSLTNNDGDSPQFETLSGTSMATPHVAGTAALLLAEKDLTPAEVKNITTYTAEDLGFDEKDQGAGRLDAYAAYQQVATTNQTENKTENQPPTAEALTTQVKLLNESAEVELSINATDADNETLNATIYLEGEEVSQQEGYGEITHTSTNLSLNTTYSWSAEVTDGINTTSTGTQSFNTDVPTEENETEKENQTRNRTKPDLPSQASDTARKARAGFFNPNSPFYGLDLAFDRASVAVGLRTKESVMEERANEARAMAEKGDNKAAEKAVKELRNTAGNSENASREAKETLNRVIGDAPEQAKKGLQNALRNVEKERKEREDNQSRPENPGESQKKSEQRNGEKPQRGNQQEESKRQQRPENPQENEPETGPERSQGEGIENLSERENSPKKQGQARQEGNQGNTERDADEEPQQSNQNEQDTVGADVNTKAEANTGGKETSTQGNADVGANLDTDRRSQSTGDSGPSNSANSGRSRNGASEQSANKGKPSSPQ